MKWKKCDVGQKSTAYVSKGFVEYVVARPVPPEREWSLVVNGQVHSTHRYMNDAKDAGESDVARRARGWQPEGVDGERLERAKRLSSWQSSDPDVRMIVSAALQERGIADLGMLAMRKPEALDELYEVASDMLAQMPTEQTPGWAR